MDTLKAEQVGSAKWRVLSIPFGGEFKGGKDGDGENFSPRTDIKRDWFEKRPSLFQHGQDKDIGDDITGVEDDLRKERDGWWGMLWLDRANRYHAQIDALLRAGKMYGSSGALGHLVKKAPDGEILVWPHIELTLTPTPANRLARIVPAKAAGLFASAGLELDPAFKGLLTEHDSPSDLGPDLPSGGDDPAKLRLAATLDQLTEVLAHLRS